MADSFSKWEKWANKTNLKNIDFPGVYIIALCDTNIEGDNFSWREDIIYIGMTNSKKGLKGRLKQFENTINGKSGHGGAQRVIFKFRNIDNLKMKLYVSVCHFECDVNSNKPKDLLIMGDVAKFEYVCFAKYVEIFKRLPEFNDKELSPKN